MMQKKKERGFNELELIAYRKRYASIMPFFDALDLLTPEEKENIYELARQLRHKIPGLGVLQALELLYKIGIYLAKERME